MLPLSIERKIALIDMDEVTSSLSFFRKMRSVLSKDEMLIALAVSEATYYKFVNKIKNVPDGVSYHHDKGKLSWRLWELYTNARYDAYALKEVDDNE